MTNWVRLWEDMPTDPKWRVIARRSGRPLPEVLAVFVFMMTNAGANAAERGRLQGWDDEDVAAALDMDGEHVSAIRDAMEGKTLDGDRLTGWERRQPKREDNSSERAKAWREAKKREQAQDNDIERTRTQPNAAERERTLDKNRIDTDISSSLRSEDEPRAKRASVAQKAAEDFERFWQAWPNKVAKRDAAKAFLKVAGELDAILCGIERYMAAKPPDRDWMHPATFLNGRRWEDAHPPPAARAGPAPSPTSAQKRDPYLAAREQILGEIYGRPSEETFRRAADDGAEVVSIDYIRANGAG